MKTEYVVILKIVGEDTMLELAKWASQASAEQSRRNWRKVLGNKNWTVDRRPGLDTLDHLCLTIIKREV